MGRLTVSEITLPKGYLSGLTTELNSASATSAIDVLSGIARSDTDNYDIRLTTTRTKQVHTNWASGSGGGWPSGLATASASFYHVFAIAKKDGTTDAGFDNNLSAANLLSDATGYSAYRRIGSVFVGATGLILAYTQYDDQFIFDLPIENFNATAQGTAAVDRAFSVPTGLKVEAIVNIHLQDSATSGTEPRLLLTTKDQTDTAPSTAAFNMVVHNGNALTGDQIRIQTDTNATVRTRLNVSNASTIVRGQTIGWIDKRGK